MSVKERLKKFVEFKELTASAFCKSIGVSNAYISSMNKSIQPDKIESITLKYPELNISWLLTGEGEMLTGMRPEEAPPDKKRDPEDIKLDLKLEMMQDLLEEMHRREQQYVTELAELRYLLNKKNEIENR